MKCDCDCHTNQGVKHFAACCCNHQYTYDCPVEGCWKHRPEVVREFGGIEITEDFVNDLVEEWHENFDTFPTELSAFIRANTGWSKAEYEQWAITGVLP